MPALITDPITIGAIAAMPWLLLPVALTVRLGGALSLGTGATVKRHWEPGATAGETTSATPRVSIIVPARNEATHIGECLRSILASSWADLEVIVVNDHSTDGTRDLALAAADGDARVRVIDAPDLPPGWFGKQWACQAGAQAASGSLLLFTDADTRHHPDLVGCAVAFRARRQVELLSVAGRQDAVTIWERAVQPLVFSLILARYGTAASLERATRASDVIANGQCFLLSREAYWRIGGHASVRGFVAEDVMMAQRVWSDGGRVSLAMGTAHLRTRMYDSLPSLIEGWSKNVYAGGRHTVRGGAVGRALFPFALLAYPIMIVAPFATVVCVVLAGALGVGASTGLLCWSVLSSLAVLAASIRMNVLNGDRWTRAALAPLGGLVLLVIFAAAVFRGSAVRWKDRDYTAH